MPEDQEPSIEDPSDGWKEFDLSALSYAEFLAYFFDRPIVGDDKEYDLFRAEIDRFVASDPGVVVRHVKTMCESLAELTKVYSADQITQGLWAVLGVKIDCQRFVFDPAVDSKLRTDCIASMYPPFRDVVSRITGDIRHDKSYYWMWWDMVPQTFWTERAKSHFDNSENYSDLTDDQKLMADAMCEALSKILAIDNRNCQLCALHGFGHLHHPLGKEIVQHYLDEHRSEFSEKDVTWIEDCRDGRVM